MKKEFKGTLANVEISYNGFNNEGEIFVGVTNSAAIARIYDGNSLIDNREKAIANANLIAEAFNVVNECGLTPRQLAEQNNELLEALKELTNANSLHDGFHEKRLKALAAIKNAETIKQ